MGHWPRLGFTQNKQTGLSLRTLFLSSRACWAHQVENRSAKETVSGEALRWIRWDVLRWSQQKSICYVYRNTKSAEVLPSDWGKEMLFVAKLDGSFVFWSGWVRHSNQESETKWCTGSPRVAVLSVQLAVLGYDSIQPSKCARIALNLGKESLPDPCRWLMLWDIELS